jgi:hypothetical protein
VRLLTPFIARTVAREMLAKYPGLTPQEIGERMRGDMPGPLDEQGARFVEAVVARLPRDRGSEEAGDFSDHSTWVLVAANLFPLYGVLALDWPVFPLLALFWFENVVVGVLNAARMLLADPGDAALWGAKLFMVPFFCLHYGMFTAIHGVFVLGLFGGKAYNPDGLWVLGPALRAAQDFHLWLPAAVLAGSHLFSFLWNYLWRGEYKQAELMRLMGRPYKRVVVLHLGIILGGFLVTALHSPEWALVVLIAVKTYVDLRAHRKDHKA